MTQEILTFVQAIDKSGMAKRNLLLGNGFSIACEPSIFHYESLYTQASEKLAQEFPEIAQLFEKQKTRDFEVIIHMLQNAGAVLPFYLPSDSLIAKKILNHTDKLKEILINTIADNHPSRPNDIPLNKYKACRQFLSYFISPENDGRIYTLNYDLLLYWSLMNEDADGNEFLALEINDGFGKNLPEDSYVIWMNDNHSKDQRVFYLHGATHLFDSGTELEKYTWSNSRLPLIEQARQALISNKLPLFVAEGTSKQKLEKIKHQIYLSHCYKSFKQIMHQKTQILFIFGHSLAENDDHIIKLIGKGRIPGLFVGIYGDAATEDNQRIIRKALSLKNLREDKNPLEVNFYNAESASVWG